jgi:hypothetical protein
MDLLNQSIPKETNKIYIPYNEVYKVYQEDFDGNLKHVIVFNGKSEDVLNLNELFSEIEIAEFGKYNVIPKFSKQLLHGDDSISTIKMKLINEFGINDFCYEEIYLYSKVKNSIDFSKLYQDIVSKINSTFSKEMFGQLISNLQLSGSLDELSNLFDENDTNIENISHEMFLSKINTLINDKFDMNEFEYNIPLGKRFSTFNNMLYSVNPFDILPLSSDKPIFQENSNNTLLTFDNSVLLNYGDLIDKKIYVCFADDVLDYAINNAMNEEYIIRTYFPFLSKLNILSRETFFTNKQSRISETKKLLTPQLLRLYDTVDTFYNIYYNKTDYQLPYIEKGINSFEIILHPEYKTILPLEVIFKQLRSTRQIPFIKYSPGFQKENIYRLYSEKMSRSSKKIPFLNKNQIMSLSRESFKKKQITMYVEHEHMGELVTFFIELYLNGNISIRSKDTPIPYSKNQLETLFLETVNPILNSINEFLLQTGYKLNNFESLKQRDVEIVDIKYICSIGLNKKIKFNEYLNCLTSIFDIIDISSKNSASNAVMRFKRVDNYEKMDAISAMISEKFKNSYNEREIIQSLMLNYELSELDALNKITQFLNDHTQINGRYVNKSVDIIDNPGFPVNFRIPSLKSEIYIEINKINDIDYIDILYLYLDSFFRFTQNPETITIPINDINEIFNLKVKNVVVPYVANVIIPTVFAETIVDNPVDDDEYLNDIIENEEENEIIDDVGDDDEDEEGIFFEDSDGEQEDETPAETPAENPVETPAENPVETPAENPVETPAENPAENPAETPAETPAENPAENPAETDSKNSSSSPEGIFFEDSDSSPESKKSLGGAKRRRNVKDEKNIFLQKIRKMEPKFFMVNQDEEYDGYARLCQANSSRQPVIITDEEKQKIDREHPGSYKNGIALNYGSDPNKKNWYICPRYWCIPDNTSLTEDEVKNGACGGKVITREMRDNPPPGHYIYEFTDPDHIDKNDGSYIDHYPGFLDKKSHPENVCMPCCFKKSWDAKQQVDRRKECMDTTDKENVTTQPESEMDFKSYIVGFDKYPLQQTRWGYLPLAVELFLKTDNSIAQSKQNPAIIKPNTPVLLRYGVEQSRNQSFLGCLADIYALKQEYYKKGLKTPTITEMRDILAENISLDMFLKYHNGSLPAVFKPKKIEIQDDTINKYSNTEFFKTIDTSNESQMDFLEDTIAAFENFLNFLRDPDSLIDHTYLWDIVTSDDSKILSKGINLVIIEIIESDITDNIQILCPTNSYSDKFYDKNRETLILLKQNKYYEPIYGFEDKKSERQIITKKTFTENTKFTNLKSVLQMINNVYNKSCKALPSMPNVYKFKKNISLNELYKLLIINKLLVESQVMNYQSKIIGVLVNINQENKNGFFIPCYPSSSMDNIKTIYMDDIKWNDYYKTRDFLTSISSNSNGNILCKPRMKIIEDNLIVGILTETNQFVQIDPPVPNDIEDGIPSLNNTNYLVADKTIFTTKKDDTIRSKTIRKITLETQFYSAFRTTIRILLNDYLNREVRDKIVDLLDNPSYLYRNKLKKIVVLLKHLTRNSVLFDNFNKMPEELIYKLTEISSCISNCNNKKYCLTKENGSCLIMIPKKNLVNARDNSIEYFVRIADELLRYKRIRLFMLNPKRYLNISNIEYHIETNEIIMLQSLLNSDYFDDLIPFEMNNYINNINYDLANPIITQKYSNNVSLDTQYNFSGLDNNEFEKFESECIKEKYDNITNSKWRRIIPSNAKEIVFDNTQKCSFIIINYILQERLKTNVPIETIRKILWNSYADIYEKYKIKIIKILSKQGKSSMMKRLSTNQIQFQDLIMSEEYFITNLDLWAISSKYNLPLLLFSSRNLKNLSINSDWLILGGNPSENYYTIRCPFDVETNDTIPSYNLIMPTFKLNELKGFDGMINNPEYIQNTQTITTFLELYR